LTRTNHDQFAKQFLTELLTPFGSASPGYEIASEVRQVDLWFTPSEVTTDQSLGLLSQMASTPCLFEPFRNSPSRMEVRTCLLKLFELQTEFLRQSRRERAASATNARLKEDDLPRLWILSPSASPALLAGFGATPQLANWSVGVYFLANDLRAALVAINQLPQTEETLWLRILGKGPTQQRAVNELLAYRGHPLSESVLELLANWRITLAKRQTLDRDDEELLMNLSPAYLRWREETLQQGEQKGKQEGRQEERREVVENLLKVRFGELDEELSSLIEPLLRLPSGEFAPLLLNLERSELLNRFGEQNS